MANARFGAVSSAVGPSGALSPRRCAFRCRERVREARPQLSLEQVMGAAVPQDVIVNAIYCGVDGLPLATHDEDIRKSRAVTLWKARQKS